MFNFVCVCKQKFSRWQLKKAKANSLHVQKQFDHETRKKERELSKLKERIHQLLTDKNQEKKVGLDILNLINRPAGGQRALWKTGSAKYVPIANCAPLTQVSYLFNDCIYKLKRQRNPIFRFSNYMDVEKVKSAFEPSGPSDRSLSWFL